MLLTVLQAFVHDPLLEWTYRWEARAQQIRDGVKKTSNKTVVVQQQQSRRTNERAQQQPMIETKIDERVAVAVTREETYAIATMAIDLIRSRLSGNIETKTVSDLVV